jgi:alkanesulfonate monooxygenase SsuD/methylene tetrahydromethanopterin reductase-like flavin-dependent oxidoreductase (luciferase family)
MKLAIGLPTGVPATPGPGLVEWARRAEAAGFSSLGTIGRTVFDSHEELVALAGAAGATQRIRLATTVMVAPPRDPVLLAKQAATLDSLSGGRLDLGLGVGWRDDDFRAARGADFAGRGKGLDELVATLRRIWAGEAAGEGLGPVGPRPAQAGGPPIWLGGAAPAALRRAGRLGDAFIAMPVSPSAVQGVYDVAAKAREEAGRPGRLPLVGAGYYALGDQAEAGRRNMAAYYAFGGEAFVRSMTDALLTTPDAIRAHVAGYREIGMDELFLWPASSDLGQIEALAEVVL